MTSCQVPRRKIPMHGQNETKYESCEVLGTNLLNQEHGLWAMRVVVILCKNLKSHAKPTWQNFSLIPWIDDKLSLHGESSPFERCRSCVIHRCSFRNSALRNGGMQWMRKWIQYGYMTSLSTSIFCLSAKLLVQMERLIEWFNAYLMEKNYTHDLRHVS